MKKLVFGLFGLIGLIIIAVFIVPFFIPKDVYRSQIETQAEAALGRDVTIGGDIGLSVFPALSAKIDGFEIANPEGFSDPLMIKAGSVRAIVKWLPLFSGRVEIGSFVLEDAVVSLEQLADGRTNWVFETAGESAPSDSEESDAAPLSGGIDALEFTNANVTYRDASTGQNLRIEALNLRGQMRDTASVLSLSGDGIVQGEALKFSLQLDSVDKALANAAMDLKADITLAGADIRWAGSVLAGDAVVLNGVTSGEISSLAGFVTSVKALAPDLVVADMPPLEGLGALAFEAALSGSSADALSVSLNRLSLTGEALKATLNGTAKIGETITYDMGFAANTADTGGLIGIYAPDTLDPNLSGLLKAFEAKGRVSGTTDKLTAKVETFRQRGEGLDVTWVGDIALPLDTLEAALKGKFTGEFSNFPELAGFAETIGLTPEAFALLGKVTLSGAINGPAATPQIDDLTLNHTGANGDFAFEGNVNLAPNGALAGAASLSTNAVQTWLTAMDLDGSLPGVARFSYKSTIGGVLEAVTLNAINLTLDDIQVTGQGVIEPFAVRPKLSGQLTTNALDLTRFLGEETPPPTNTTPTSQAWSDDPLALEGLDAMDMAINITAPEVVIGDMKLSSVLSDIRLINGKFSADITQAQSFGGAWKGQFALDTKRATPSLNYDLDGQSIALSDLLATLVGVDRISGIGLVNLTGQSSGNSLKAIVAGLSGGVNVTAKDGAVQGLNISQLVRSRESLGQALLTGALNGMDFSSVLSPEAETDFTGLLTKLTIKNGIATLDDFNFENPFLVVTASGSVNLLEQTMDLRLVPKVDKAGGKQGSALQLNGLPIPIRISGAWTAPGLAPDYAFVRQELQRDLKSRAVEQLLPKLTEQAGVKDLLGAIVAPSTTAPTPTTTTVPTTPTQPTPEEIVADPEKAVKSIFGNLLQKEIDKRTGTDKIEPAEVE